MTLPTAYEWFLESGDGEGGTGGTGSTLESAGPASGIGKDIWFDLHEGDGANRHVTPAGDWLLCDGEVALRQSLLRRLLTNPGEWATKPDYGVGARQFVKAKNMQAVRDELTHRIAAQFLRDYRVAAVEAVVVDQTVDGVLRLSVKVKTKITPARNQPLLVAVTLS